MKQSLSGFGHKRVIKAFQKAGWVLSGGTRHTKMEKPGHPAKLIIPRHDPVKQFLLRGLIRTAGMTEAEFLDLI